MKAKILVITLLLCALGIARSAKRAAEDASAQASSYVEYDSDWSYEPKASTYVAYDSGWSYSPPPSQPRVETHHHHYGGSSHVHHTKHEPEL